jgi:hypothetical protein
LDKDDVLNIPIALIKKYYGSNREQWIRLSVIVLALKLTLSLKIYFVPSLFQTGTATNCAINLSGDPADYWLLALQYVGHALNFFASVSQKMAATAHGHKPTSVFLH